ncbi:hypothetical protein Moror_11950 [Moniliophthora roreri MCA 2997]|uniref:peptidylprolyl isomerase n=2 Tax=Moniliophthora roreri TaxID=221103 RepID=V2Y5Y4_MONRO|nr:hypothetical protein Moror_11950 [Moniliophthora roreri MCA 2997]KAI3615575.1 hypothetical protein WG66_011930 [Moniliophthora roreri]
MSSQYAYLDIYAGDKAEYESRAESYAHTCSLLSKHAEVFGLPTSPDLLSSEQQDILRDVNKDDKPLLFTPPTPLLAGRITFELDTSPGLTKTRQNFISLCTGEKGFAKGAPNKKLHYLGCAMHRIVKGFVAQGGDCTRGDGSGGESIYGPKFASEKAGLQVSPVRGSLAMANSGGKNPNNTSQFFIVLTNDQKSLDKLKGKYVVFGRVKPEDADSEQVLQRLDEVGAAPGSKDEKPIVPVWIGDCGVC